MLNDTKLTGIGLLEFLSAQERVLSDEYAAVCLKYIAYHGGEDKYRQPNPNDESKFVKETSDLVINKSGLPTKDIDMCLKTDTNEKMSIRSLDIIKDYTIEGMVERQIPIINDYLKGGNNYERQQEIFFCGCQTIWPD